MSGVASYLRVRDASAALRALHPAVDHAVAVDDIFLDQGVPIAEDNQIVRCRGARAGTEMPPAPRKAQASAISWERGYSRDRPE